MDEHRTGHPSVMVVSDRRSRNRGSPPACRLGLPSFTGPDVLLCDFAGTWLWVRARTTLALDGTYSTARSVADAPGPVSTGAIPSQSRSQRVHRRRRGRVPRAGRGRLDPNRRQAGQMILPIRGRWGHLTLFRDGGGIQGVRYPWVAATIGASPAAGDRGLHEGIDRWHHCSSGPRTSPRAPRGSSSPRRSRNRPASQRTVARSRSSDSAS